MFRRWLAVPAVAVVAALIEFGLILMGGSGVASAAELCGTSGVFSSSATAATCAYSTAGEDTFVVPSGVTSVSVTAVGGAGGAGINGASGGPGALASATLSLASGSTLYVEVGSNGGPGPASSTACPGGQAGGNGGAAGGSTPAPCGAGFNEGTPGGGGGGASDVRTTPALAGGLTAQPGDPRLLVAGGGGGGGGADSFPGGSGGSAGDPTLSGAGSGGDATCSSSGDGSGMPGGTGGIGSGGGGAGSSPTTSTSGQTDACFAASGAAGTPGSGGAGASLPFVASTGASGGGGGGGGGYLGGGGGGANLGKAAGVFDGAGGGGGGSSFGPAGSTFSTAPAGATPEVVISFTSLQTTTSLSSSANPSVVGQPVTYTASVSPLPPGGTVSFSDGGNAISGCSAVAVNASTGNAICTVTYQHTAGSPHQITASYSGYQIYQASQSAVLSQVVNRAPTSLVAAPARRGLLAVTFSATLTGYGGAPVAGKTIVFSVYGHNECQATTNSSGVASCSARPAIVITIGAATYTATFAGDADYAGSSGTGKL